MRAWRSARGMTLTQLAHDLNISPAYLSALEHGQRGRPSPGLVMQICGALDIIWDDAEELKRLAELSHPKVTIDTSGLSPAATELANRLARRIRDLPEERLEQLLGLLRE
jgi:transcriptional regulator with XRE-family HTH domain